MATKTEQAYPKSRKIRAVDPGRLRRALTLGVVKLGPGQYRVSGSSEPFYDVHLHEANPCPCADSFMRGTMCKHEIICRCVEGDAKLMQAVGDLLLKREEQMAELTRRTKKRR